MLLIRVAAAVLNQTPMDWAGNSGTIRAAIAEARRRDVDILCLPELCVTGYGCEDAFYSPALREMAWQVLEELLPETRGMIVSLGLPVMHRNALFNCAAVAVDGQLRALVAKRHLAGDGLHYEPRWFKPWPPTAQSTIDRPGRAVPIGDLHLNIGGVRVGFEICEDAWVAARPGAELAARGIDVILNPSASHFALGKHAVRRRLVLEGSRAFGLTYVYSNLLGNEAGRAIYDGDAMIASSGRLIAAGSRFSFRPWQLVDAVVDIETTRTLQARTSSFEPSVGVDALCLDVDHRFRMQRPSAPVIEVDPWERAEALSFEEFARAEALALFDYARKSRSRGFVVSLSGGVDSAACALLAALMVRLGVAELGASGFKSRLGCTSLHSGDARGLTQELLTTIYQSTHHSSQATRAAARGVAEALHSRHHEFDVSDLVARYVALGEEAEGRALEWSRDDLALQNIQARARAPGAWLLANLRGALLLTTSNRSEAAVGYATMDGDTSGGLAPLGGIDKDFLRGWLRWMERVGPTGIGPLPALHAVNAMPPTAELRPPGADQTDEGDLMPYDVLEAIEDAAVGHGRSPRECLAVLRESFPGHEESDRRLWIRRFFTLWSRSQWKRERLAPSFHVDDKNLDPRSWCRFPILSGGYARELEELESEEIRPLRPV
jgi:NAD+ synthase (glutamine-hydrolysing)